MNIKHPSLFLTFTLLLTLGYGSTNNSTNTREDVCEPSKPCKRGMIFPVWRPVENIGVGDKFGRAMVYGLALCYMFLGVSIISDRFMAAIEVITSQEREVTVRQKSGDVYTVTVRVWNETVSNLSLMALGSSAPEIMLSIIEVCGSGFKAGDLGPNTIVGSAAFNLFMIIGICIYVIPAPQVRRQQHLRVFFVTATWSIFAYIWLYIILSVSSYGVIEIWEGLLTFAFFPLTVLTAYIADKKLFPKRPMARRYSASAKKLEEAEMVNKPEDRC